MYSWGSGTVLSAVISVREGGAREMRVEMGRIYGFLPVAAFSDVKVMKFVLFQGEKTMPI